MTELYDDSRDDPKGYAMSDEGINGQMSAVEMLLAENKQNDLDVAKYENEPVSEGQIVEDLPW